MNRFVIVTFDMDGSMVTFEGSRFTETQQAAIFHMVERAGKEPVSPGEQVLAQWEREDTQPRTTILDHGDGRTETLIESAASVRVREQQEAAAATPVTGTIGAMQRQQAMEANRDAARAQAAERVQQARGMGYTGDLCTQCGSDRMKRNGSCLCCESCGATTGCS